MTRLYQALCTGLLLVLAIPATAGELLVSAAASLTDAFREIAASFEQSHKDTTVVLNFGGSGLLLQQIRSGAPVDVFATADMETMDQAAAAGLIVESTRLDMARNALVLVVPADNPAGITGVADLGGVKVSRVAISNPETVPVGRYTRAALQARGLWAPVAARMISTQNVRQSLDYVARGEVDAGFVYATDASLMPDKVRVAETVTTPTAIIYPIAAVRQSARQDLAREFIAYTRSAPAQAILKKLGFKPY